MQFVRALLAHECPRAAEQRSNAKICSVACAVVGNHVQLRPCMCLDVSCVVVCCLMPRCATLFSACATVLECMCSDVPQSVWLARTCTLAHGCLRPPPRVVLLCFVLRF